MTVRMDIFRWRRRKNLGSNMDARFGDPSISAPTQGSWNEMPYLRTANFAPLPNKVTRFKTLLQSDAVKSSELSGSTDGTNFPRHPRVDMQPRKPPISVDRQRSVSRTRQSPSPKARHRVSCESLSCSEEDEEEQQDRPEFANGGRNTVRRNGPNRSRSQEDNWRAQPKNNRRDSQQSSTQLKSPPLSATAVMRRYSSQSESTRTYTSTPSTATFSSRHTSITTPGLHGFSSSSIPPLLKEEEYATMIDKDAPPVPPIPRDRNGSVTSSSSPPSASRSVFREQHRAGNSNNKRRNGGPVGPQELVPSNDELWGY